MSKTSVPPKVQCALWAHAAGRCEYRGCNEDLIGDLVSGREDGTFGFIAHIVADVPGGPRGDPALSPQLAKSLGNLMILCARHHKQIDVESVATHPRELLLEMKSEHEARVATATGIAPERASHVLRFGASIGKNEALITTQAIFSALSPDYHPAERRPLDLELVGCAIEDNETEYWTLQRRNLQQQFAPKVAERIERREISHLSVFALAPQPLLIELGRMLCDIVPITVRQRLREPAGWAWQTSSPPLAYVTGEPPSGRTGPVALKLGVSGTVDDDRITSVLGSDAAIWSLGVPTPGNDVVRRPEDLSAFRSAMRSLYERIKARHGQQATLHIFPALPASLAVEVGRVWMPKADLALRLYDHQRERGFVPAFDLGRSTC